VENGTRGRRPGAMLITVKGESMIEADIPPGESAAGRGLCLLHAAAASGAATACSRDTTVMPDNGSFDMGSDFHPPTFLPLATDWRGQGHT